MPAQNAPKLVSVRPKFEDVASQHKSLRQRIFVACEENNLKDLDAALTAWDAPALKIYRLRSDKPLGYIGDLRAPDQSNPAFSAAAKGHMGPILRLRDFDPQLITAVDVMGRGLVHAAAANGREHMITPLKELGLDISLPDKRLRTPAHEAAMNGHIGPILEIHNNGGDINTPDRSTLTPRMHAASRRDMKLAYMIGSLLDAPQRGVTIGADAPDARV